MQRLETDTEEPNYNAFVHTKLSDNYKCMNVVRLFLRQIYKAAAVCLVWIILEILKTDKAGVKELNQLEDLSKFLVFCWVFSVIYDIYEIRYGYYTSRTNLMWVPCSCLTCWIPLNCLNSIGCGTRDCLRSVFKCWWYYTACIMCCGSLRNPISNPTMFIEPDIAFDDVVTDSV